MNHFNFWKFSNWEQCYRPFFIQILNITTNYLSLQFSNVLNSLFRIFEFCKFFDFFRSIFQQKYFILLVLIFVIFLLIAGYVSKAKRSPRVSIEEDDEEGEFLSPPDPEVAQPPSWSKLRTFKRAAVCVDGVACAQIGK